MKNQKQVDDAAIISAVLSTRTRKEAAERLQMSERQLYERLKSYELQSQLAAARADALRIQVQSIQDAQSDAVRCILDIMKSNDSSVSERLRAAALILDIGKSARAELNAADADAVGKVRGAGRMDKEMETERRRLNGEIVLEPLTFVS